jgi:exodeoxyribonuclease V alpha subunit
VDEVSMIDVRLMASLLSALPRPCWLLLVGDADQLPSVGPGDVLRDIIRARTVPVMRLRTVHRQRFGSAIVENAHRVNRGETPDFDDSSGEFYFVEATDPEDARQKILEIVCRRAPRRFGLDATRDIQVLAPMIRGAAGVERLNAELQTTLNPEGREIQRYGRLFREGDRVMQRVNNYDREVFNGDIGWVRTIDPPHDRVTVEFDGRRVDYDTADIDEMSLAYAATVHKSQGSEYPAVVLSFLRQHAIMLERNLLYTAITRAQRLAVIVGQKEAVAMALRNVRARVRWTRLSERLRGEHLGSD